MIKNTWRRLATAMCALAISGAANSAVLSISTPDLVVNAGDSVTVDVAISGLGSGTAPSLGGFDFDLNYDPSVLSFNTAVIGDPILGNQLDLFGFGSFPFITPTSGSINFFDVSFDLISELETLQADAFTLVQVSFSAVARGISDLVFGSSTLLSDASANPITDVSFQTTSVEVLATDVPVPGTLALLPIGLFSLRLLGGSRLRYRLRHRRA